jgi:subtilisin family serine protease
MNMKNNFFKSLLQIASILIFLVALFELSFLGATTKAADELCAEDIWECTEWNQCSLDGQQARTCNLSDDCLAVESPQPSTIQSCTPACTEDTWTCTEWNQCSLDGQQARTCNLSNDCLAVESPQPSTIQSCTPACTEDTWTCTEWNQCSLGGQQNRTCTLVNDCLAVDPPPPIITQSCTPACTEDSWTCTDWNQCSVDGVQTRTCNMDMGCHVDFSLPPTTQSCAYGGPTITAIDPGIIYPGTRVTLTGENFKNVDLSRYTPSTSKVLINDKEVAGVFSWDWSNTRIAFTMPKDAKTGFIQIQDSKGNKGNKIEITVSLDPSMISPLISSISPKAITPGGILNIYGSNFGTSKGSSYLVIGGSKYPSGKIISWTDSQIQYKTSIYDNSSESVGVQKCSSYFDCHSTVYGGYFFIQPEITSVDKNSGPAGTRVRISGNYLKNLNVRGDNTKNYWVNIFFNGVGAEIVTWNASSLDVVVPSAATSGLITLEMSNENESNKVIAIGPSFTVHAALSIDKFSGMQDYFRKINLPQAWGLSNSKRIITVAVLDQGIYSNHPDLQDHLWTNSDELPGNGIDDDLNGYVDDFWGWNYVKNSNDVNPTGGHGTEVAGIIGAIRDNGIGISGVNQNVRLMPLVVLDSRGGGDSNSLNRAIRYAVDNGAEVINLSLSTAYLTSYSSTYDDSIKYAYDHNVLVVVAGGNGDIPLGNGFNLDLSPQSPVCNDGESNMVIGVGALTQDVKNRPRWSNYGQCVDVWAPGENIITTSDPNFTHSSLSIDGSGYYTKVDGTSFAAPIVTGVVSLLKATYPEITSQEVISLLIDNTTNDFVIDAYKTLSANYTPPKVQAIQNLADNTQEGVVLGTNITNNSIKDPSNLNDLLAHLSVSRNMLEEEKYKSLIRADSIEFKISLSSEQQSAITNFVSYGISTKTVVLGSGERRAVIRDYFETVGRPDVRWDDIERMVNGQKVLARNLPKEVAQVNTVLKVFKKIYGHDPKFSDPKEDLVWNTMMYRIRFPRDLLKERSGINKFKKIFGYTPKSPLDWSSVRAFGYIIN